jgi:hypothetical protein
MSRKNIENIKLKKKQKKLHESTWINMQICISGYEIGITS